MTPKQFCERYLDKYTRYTINPDNTIDVNGDVDLDYVLGKMEKLPVKFGKVSGSFLCNYTKLTTLEGCPNYIGGHFSFFNNTTFLNIKYVGGNFHCNILTHHILGNVQGNIFYYNKHRIVI
jgi:hypothetical protein